MNSCKIYIKIIFLLFTVQYVNEGFAQDKSEDKAIDYYWENTTKYLKTWVVNQNHPHTSDSNSGTREKPFRTINKALEKVNAGERILIQKGIYRERLVLLKSGLSVDKMISLEAPSGVEVAVRGSNVLHVKWVQNLASKSKMDGEITQSRSKKLWITTLTEKDLDNVNSLSLKNDTSKYYLEKFGENNYPNGLIRILLFQNGQRMMQVHSYGDLIYLQGAFWVDSDHKTLHIHPYNNKNPNDEFFEIASADFLLATNDSIISYVQIKGITFEHCANGFNFGGIQHENRVLSNEKGAIDIKNSHHLILENNTIKDINACALKIGSIDGFNNSNHIIIRKNKLFDIGTSAISLEYIEKSIIRDNMVLRFGWHDSEMALKPAGIMVDNSSNIAITSNKLFQSIGAAGISLFNQNSGITVSRNIMSHIATMQGAVYIENTNDENLLSNNLIWNINGKGISGLNCSQQLFYHNLIGRTSESPVSISYKIQYSSEKNQILNNLIVDCNHEASLSTISSISANNLFVISTKIKDKNLKKWQRLLVNKQGSLIRGDASFKSETLMFKWESKNEVKSVPAIDKVGFDIANQKRNESFTIPGPFRTLPSNSSYYVSLKKN